MSQPQDLISMNRNELNDWLSLAANLGVILGLVFLGIQINQSNKITAAATYQARISEIEASFQNAALSDYLPSIYDQLESEGVSSLSSIELRRLRDWETARVYRMQGQHYQYRQGFLDDPSFEDLLVGARDLLPLWESLGIDQANFDPEFIELTRN